MKITQKAQMMQLEAAPFEFEWLRTEDLRHCWIKVTLMFCLPQLPVLLLGKEESSVGWIG